MNSETTTNQKELFCFVCGRQTTFEEAQKHSKGNVCLCSDPCRIVYEKSERMISGVKTETPCCPHCSSEEVYGISRVVGYFSIIDNWNKSKRAELKRRQKGNYWGEEIDE